MFISQSTDFYLFISQSTDFLASVTYPAGKMSQATGKATDTQRHHTRIVHFSGLYGTTNFDLLLVYFAKYRFPFRFAKYNKPEGAGKSALTSKTFGGRSLTVVSSFTLEFMITATSTSTRTLLLTPLALGRKEKGRRLKETNPVL